MEAPDKIYVKEFNEGISQMWSGAKATKTTANLQHEYIRKGALLEWAKEIKRQAEELREEGYGDVFYGAQIALIDEVINKLNSL